MIGEIEIRNFRCLQNVIVPLKPLTVLIGPNDSGKSAFLTAVGHLVSGTEKFKDADFWRFDTASVIYLLGNTSEGRIELRYSGKEGRSKITPQESAIRGKLTPIQRFQLPSTGVPMECEGYSQKQEPSLTIDLNGNGVPALLDYLLRKERKRFANIIDALRSNIPGLEDIEISTPSSQTRRVDLVIEGGLRLRADEASVGVRMLLFFVALAYHPKPPRTILIEEPENGVHPRRLVEVMSLLRAISKGRYGNYPAQVILTTHSPYLLDSVHLDEDQVLVFQRLKDGSRTAKPVDKARMQNYLDEFMLGEVWFNEEEAGLIAKP